MLPQVARLNPSVSLRGKSTLLICCVALCVLPTWFVAAQSPDANMARNGLAAPAVEFLPELSQAEQAIERELDSPTSFDFTDETLDGVCEVLRTRHKLNVLVDDHPSLESESESSETTHLTLKVDNIPLRSALKLLRQKRGWAFYVEDDVLKITPDTGYGNGGGTRTYPVRDLVGDDAGNYELLIKAIQEGADPLSWKGATIPEGSYYDKGSSFATISMLPASGSLVIRQTWDGHAEVLRLLRSLRQAGNSSPRK